MIKQKIRKNLSKVKRKVLARRYKKIKELETKSYLLSLVNDKYRERLNTTIKKIENSSDDYIVFYNKDWFGVSNATIELFKNPVDLGEILDENDIEKIATIIINKNFKQVIFSSFAINWKKLCILLKQKNKNIKIKTFWHGSHSQILDTYSWERNKEIIDLHKNKIIDVMGTCKKTLLPFYEYMGYNASFLTNKVDVKIEKEEKNTKTTIGLYAAKCSDWRKNMYTQMLAVSLMDNVTLDMVPLNDEAISFAKSINLEITGEKNNIKREELIKRMSKNDVNLYVTFSECAPMLPLESLEVDVPCITGNNHHYFENNNLKKHLVIDNEEDAFDIKLKIENAIENKTEIINEYKKFREENLKESEKLIKEFLEK